MAQNINTELFLYTYFKILCTYNKHTIMFHIKEKYGHGQNPDDFLIIFHILL